MKKRETPHNIDCMMMEENAALKKTVADLEEKLEMNVSAVSCLSSTYFCQFNFHKCMCHVALKQ